MDRRGQRPRSDGARLPVRCGALKLPNVDELIGVYDADGGFLGELRYALGKVLARSHCSLCDLTHRGVRRRDDWDRMVTDLGVPVRLLHRDEMDGELRDLVGGVLPAVVARRSGRLDRLLGPEELAACQADPRAFERRVRVAAAS
jgi:hypothetical protein